MQLSLVFEVLLLVAIVAGAFVGWDGTQKKQRRSLRKSGSDTK